MKPFIKIDKLGQLNIDVVLFESYYPILFTCLNENEDLFLCVCCQSNQEGRKWLITKTAPNILVKVLKNELTVRKAFLEFPQVQVSVFSHDGKILQEEHNELDWDEENSVCLPDKGEFLDAEEGEFDKEISYYESLNSVNYHTDFKESKTILSSQQMEKEINLIDKLELSKVYYKELDSCLKNHEIYKQIKKEILEIILDQCKNNSMSYHEPYEEMEKKISKENLALKEYTIEKSIKEITEAA